MDAAETDRAVEICRYPRLTTTLGRVHHGCTRGAVLPSERTQTAGGEQMSQLVRQLWSDDSGQDIAEYAVMLAVILVLVVGTIRLIGTNANNAFSNVASSIQ
jgi:Flp pilus assembly pilin Flp